MKEPTIGNIVIGETIKIGYFRQENIELDYRLRAIEYISNINNSASAADYIVNAEIIAAKGAATMALSNLGDSIAYIDDEAMKSTLSAFYSAVDISSPDNEFYYAK